MLLAGRTVNAAVVARDDSPEDDAVASARAARLRYVSDTMPGIRRKRAGRGFTYVDPSGTALRDPEDIQRIRHLAIPPAWTDVWISPYRNGHIQATGRDARGRKQYRYHDRWREVRDEVKYERMTSFAEHLSAIRERVDRDLGKGGLPREKVIGAVVRLLDATHIRVGNPEYARDNESFGLTTLREDHVDVTGATVRFQFRGKSGKEHTVDLQDRRVARVVARCEALPGEELFQYLDADGERHTVSSDDVNAYLREIGEVDFTAKDFRTWSGTVLAADELIRCGIAVSQSEAKRNVVEAVKQVAARLGNTPAVCRRAYIHPDVLAAYLEGRLAEDLKREAERKLDRDLSRLTPEEAAMLALLRGRLPEVAAATRSTAERRRVAASR